MTRVFVSAVADPYDRGREFGRVHAEQVNATVEWYRLLFAHTAGCAVDLDGPGADAFKATEAWAPDLADEITGIAEGAGLPVTEISAINARTEILAACGTVRQDECSAVVVLGDEGNAPVAMQTWDWYPFMSDGWLVWTIPHPDGRITRTLTEYGVVGKIGVNSAGIGLLFTILHHERDGAGIGLPVHVAARRVLDDARTLLDAATMLTTAQVSASSSLNLVAGGRREKAAISVELHPGGPGWALPDLDGVLVHTNHFLDPAAATGDRRPHTHPGTLIRRHVLRHGLREHAAAPTPAAVRAVMTQHVGPVCSHADPAIPLIDQHATLATVELDLAAGSIHATPGGPCSAG